MDRSDATPSGWSEAGVDGLAWSGFDRAVRHLPGGAAAVFRAIGVPLDVAARSGQRTPLHRYLAYFETAARMAGTPLFGLRFGARTRPERSGMPGYLALHAGSFREALHSVTRTLPLLVGGVRAELVEARDPPALLWSLTEDAGPATQFTSHATAYFVRMMQAHRGRRWRPQRVLIATPCPGRPADYRAVLGCPVAFEAPVNAIEVAREDLAARRPGDPHLYALLSQAAEALLAARPAPPPDIVAATRLALRDGWACGRGDLTFVADRLRLPRRSLQRALARRGVSFQGVLEDERFSRADALLRQGRLPVSTIATSLGYTETAAFSRAFRARAGASPRAWRRSSSLPTG